MIAGIAALRLGVAGQSALEVGAGQIIEEQVVAEVEEVASLADQVGFEGGLVRDDVAETTIEEVEAEPAAGTPSSSGKAVSGSQ